MIVGVGADHGGFEMKNELAKLLMAIGHSVVDFGNKVYDADDDYPDFAIPVARAVARGDADRGILVCGSGVGACFLNAKFSGADRHRRHLAKVLRLEESSNEESGRSQLICSSTIPVGANHDSI